MDLFVSKKIIEKLGGYILVESSINSGSKFTFAFPYVSKSDHTNSFVEIQEEDQLQSSQEISKYECISPSRLNEEFRANKEKEDEKEKYIENENKKFEDSFYQKSERPLIQFSSKICQCTRILIVDDEVNNRFILSNYCKRLNLSSNEAKDGEDALIKVKEYPIQSKCCQKYDLILMDSNMPKLNGEQSALEIRKFQKKNKIKESIIYCITANADISCKLNEYNVKIYDKILFKPLKFETFQE